MNRARAILAALPPALALALAGCVSWQPAESDTPTCTELPTCGACLAVPGCAWCAGSNGCIRIHTVCHNLATVSFEPAIEDPQMCAESDAGPTDFDAFEADASNPDAVDLFTPEADTRHAPLATTPAAPCHPSGWCWSHPYPTGEDLRGAWLVGAGELWAVGATGLLLHQRAGTWTGVRAAGLPGELAAVSGTPGGDVWAVGGGGTIVRFDGSAWERWTVDSTQDLASVWAVAPGDV